MQEFSAKRDALFACLDDASKELKGTALDQTRSKPYTINALERAKNQGRKICAAGKADLVETETDEKLRRLRGKESIFKKPELPIGRCLKPRKTPDYQVNPHKWKKYSLSDVDISDQTNSAAALSFLREMDAQHGQTDPADEMDNEPSTAPKVEFKKKSKLHRNLKQLQRNELEDVEVDKPQLRGSKLIMPEYVIGQRKAKKQPKSKSETRAACKLQLSHLEEEAGEEEIDD
ncbi:uncharacterized protein LOC6557362 [Drosophila grimshawi]|uniref:U5 small nuclear ribonucleoprotein TSSC4 n=1 Tax=Drosophila grimshawi TaxID=7222 RepID=B4J2U3_DROGR|nr:uncharacterized protein LOC6557362 [Drosophila grimshawi]EDV96084.1 GH15406 [Drosophila grimshawi]